MNLEHWKQFESTGRIEDYLSFVSCERQEENQRTGQGFFSKSEQDRTGGDYGRESWMGIDGYAGIYMGDGDHTEAGSGGRIR